MAIEFVGQIPPADAIVVNNAGLPQTTDAFTPANAGDWLLFFAKYEDVPGFSVTDSNGVTYAAQTPEGTTEFGDFLWLVYNDDSQANSQTLTVGNTSGGNIWEGYLYEFAGLGSISDILIEGITSDPTTGDISATSIVVPTGSMLVARCSSSGVAAGVEVAGGGTQLGSADLKGVLGGWTGADASVTPQFTGDPDTTYTVIRAILTPPSSGGTGTLAATLEDVTAVAAGELQIKGTLSATLAAVTVAASGKLQITGALSSTLDALTLVSAASHGRVGQLAATLGTLTASAAGQHVTSGALTATLDAATLTASAQLHITGHLASTLDALTLSSSAGTGPHGTVDVTLGSLSLAATGRLQITGQVSQQLAALTLTARGTQPITGHLTSTLGALTLSAHGEHHAVAIVPKATIFKLSSQPAKVRVSTGVTRFRVSAQPARFRLSA